MHVFFLCSLVLKRNKDQQEALQTIVTPTLQISITFKNQQVLKDVSWDVKKGEKVGLVGVNGAGKTTQLQIITGALQPDTGNVIKAKDNMRIAYLTQEFDVTPTNTVREEFMSAFGEQVHGQQFKV